VPFSILEFHLLVHDACITVGTQTVPCTARQGDCAYRYFVGTRNEDEDGSLVPIVFERQSK